MRFAVLLAGTVLASTIATATPRELNPTIASRSTAKAQAPRPKAPRPNVLFVLVDDMGWGDLSVMGNRKVATPHIDRLARRGVLMSRFYDASPICSSSRAGFLTGRFPAEVGFVGITANRARNAQIGQADWLDPKLPTTAKLLKGAGYATAHIGKWHLGGGRDVGDAPWPTAYGFDESFTTFEGLGPRVLVSDEERNLADQSEKLGQGPYVWAEKKALTPMYVDKSLDFIERNKDRPWFVQLWLNDVHDPWAPSAQDLAAVKGKRDDADDERFLAALVGMDRALGRLFDRLDAMGEGRDTLILLTSDNGPSPLKRYMKDGGTPPGSAGTLRGRKFSLYEGGVRQPLILAWPAGGKAGLRDDTTVGGGVDLLPTLAGVLQLPIPAGTRGTDLSPVLQGKAVTKRPPLFWAYGREGRAEAPNLSPNPRDVSPRFAVRDGDWKLLMNAGGADQQLYNLRNDPDETANLAPRQPAVRARLYAKLREWMDGLAK